MAEKKKKRRREAEEKIRRKREEPHALSLSPTPSSLFSQMGRRKRKGE
jgi:hypothetical protein